MMYNYMVTVRNESEPACFHSLHYLYGFKSEYASELIN